MSARLTFTNDADIPVEYDLDVMAAAILDVRREHPEATVTLTMSARDRATAIALLRLALDVLTEHEIRRHDA